uniref:AlNc14C94G5802 protein n=1 Tax=Albugo laibachii Nc14 TaxID=890382 RepID=F0WGS5_9STRA|nr:AlNc14C94G5802 [Albugo laibachii Nc14]|eukprot:CCA20439.1 AlNc14C94G5802 [Albugo laibachii Nc14]
MSAREIKPKQEKIQSNYLVKKENLVPLTSLPPTSSPIPVQPETTKPSCGTNRTRRPEYSLETRLACVEKHEAGLGYRRISKDLNMPLSTVKAIIRSVRRTGTIEKAHRSGRPRVTDSKLDGVMIAAVIAERQTSAAAIVRTLRETYNISISEETVRRRIREFSRQNASIAKRAKSHGPVPAGMEASFLSFAGNDDQVDTNALMNSALPFPLSDTIPGHFLPSNGIPSQSMENTEVMVEPVNEPTASIIGDERGNETNSNALPEYIERFEGDKLYSVDTELQTSATVSKAISLLAEFDLSVSERVDAKQFLVHEKNAQAFLFMDKEERVEYLHRFCYEKSDARFENSEFV